MADSQKYISKRSIKAVKSGLGYWGTLGFVAWLLAGALISRIFVIGDLTCQVLVFLFGFIWAIFGPFSLSLFLVEAGGRALYNCDYKLANLIARAGVASDRAILPLVNVIGIYDTPLAVLNLLNLANSQIMLSKFKEASTNLEAALDKSQATFGWENHLTQLVLGFLSNSYLYQSRYIEAESYLKKSIAAKSKQLKEQDEEDQEFEVLYTISSLAMDQFGYAQILAKKGLIEEAEETYREAITTILGNTEYDTDMLANHMNALGEILVEKGELEEAEPLLLRAEEIRVGVFGKQHYVLSSSYLALGYLNLKKDLLDMAEENFTEGFAIREAAGLRPHVDGAEFLRALGELNLARGNHDQARSYFDEAIDICEKTVGEDYVDLARVLAPYCKLLEEIGENDKAIALKQREGRIRADLA